MSKSLTAIQVLSPRSRFSNPAGMRCAISLHSHSEHSREMLAFLPRLVEGMPVVRDLFARSVAEYEREEGRPLDFAEWYWRPPVAPAEVVASEQEHLERRLGLSGLVSLTDHDTLAGPRALRASRPETPFSFEWSVPFERSMFHLGVHGIAAAQVDEIERALSAYAKAAGYEHGQTLEELLDWLGECPDTFVVLNHPYWDLARVGQMRHDATLLAFLRRHGDRIHALELNGYRSWTENRRVLPLATGFGIPVVGGGDRHGFTPNAIVNLTGAGCFAEFARELRVERAACCVVFPEYTQAFVARVLQSAGDILKPHPNHLRGHRTWPERVFTTIDGVERSAASMWERAPLWVDVAVGITRSLGTKPLSTLFDMVRADGRGTLETDCGAGTGFSAFPRLTSGSAAAA